MSSNTSTLEKDSAFSIANLIIFSMLNRVCQVLSIISFIMVASMSGGAYFGYKYVTSEQFKSRVMNEILGNVQGLMPKVLEKGLPDLTGPSLPIPPTMGESQI